MDYQILVLDLDGTLTNSKKEITQPTLEALIEIQEAFAAQTLADAKLMGLSATDLEQKVNVNGSGISLGHPIGATGSVRLVTLIHEMVRRDARYGLVTICGGGGLGICVIVERKSTSSASTYSVS